MKLRFRGILAELGSNYVTQETPHSGAIVQCGQQNLHFDLEPEACVRLAPHLFDVVDITLNFRPREAERKPGGIKVGNKPKRRRR